MVPPHDLRVLFPLACRRSKSFRKNKSRKTKITPEAPWLSMTSINNRWRRKCVTLHLTMFRTSLGAVLGVASIVMSSGDIYRSQSSWAAASTGMKPKLFKSCETSYPRRHSNDYQRKKLRNQRPLHECCSAAA